VYEVHRSAGVEVTLMRAVLALFGAVGLLLIGLAAVPTAVAGDPCYHGFDIPPRTEGTETQIKVAPCAFGPTVARVPVGSTVTFFNGPNFTHLITGANAEWGSRDTEVKPGQQVSFTFKKAGVYPYACALHRGMSGAIVVSDTTATGSGAATGNDEAATQTAASETPPAAQGPALAQVVAAGGAGIVLGGLAALGIVRSRSRRGQAVA
jgi:plastocyanin